VRLSACLLALLALGAAACGGGSNQHLPKKPPPQLASRCGSAGENVQAQLVWFRASDGTLLDGAAIGDGDVAVVLAHEYPSDLCAWLPYAKTLASQGFRALVFDLRGGGFSQSAERPVDSGRYDWDVEAAAAEARHLGAKKVFLVGASAGGAAVLVAAAAVSPEPAGVISLSGETNLSTNLDAMRAAPNLRAPLLLLVARRDRYVAVEDYRKLETAAASKDKRLAVYSGDWHGWDLLYKAPFKSRVNALVLGFLKKHSGDRQ
jgi:alpha-beta hydrolase superfamily lysophospholipase